MQKIIFLMVIFILNTNCNDLFAKSSYSDIEDNQVLEEVVKVNQQIDNLQLKQLEDNLKFKQFQSCADMENIFNKLFSQLYEKNLHRKYYISPIEDRIMNMPTSVQKEAGNIISNQKSENISDQNIIFSLSKDFSQTNIQVAGVDEPDIIKNNGKYLYYFNQKNKKIYIINSPLDLQTGKINWKDLNIIKIINLPTNYQNVELLVTSTRIIIIANRFATNNISDNINIIDKYNNTDLIIFDTSNFANIKLIKLFSINGKYKDARLINNQLYLFTQTDIKYYNLFPLNNDNNNQRNISNKTKISSSQILPTQLEVNYTTDTSKQINFSHKRILPYQILNNSIDCNNIFYLLPTDSTLEKYDLNPSFININVIDIDNIDKPINSKIIFADYAQIYLSTTSLYLMNNINVNYDFRCQASFNCVLPNYNIGENLLIHKFDLVTGNIEYNNSNLLPGRTLPEYSFQEDNNHNFNILTKQTSLQTNLFVLDNKLQLVGKLQNIAPGEEFKSARFISNKLYLVTFQQIDPLFVIDLANKSQPEIIGELKIPGYSKYIHPYGEETNNIQYLIGLGYDTTTNSWGGVSNGGIKLELFKIDYNEKKFNSTDILVESKYSKILGTKSSRTEALDNPRMFVWDANRKLLLLPVNLKDQKDFVGIKGYTVDINNGFLEVITQDYSQYIKNQEFKNLNLRVGYLGDIIYSLNNDFFNFWMLRDNNWNIFYNIQNNNFEFPGNKTNTEIKIEKSAKCNYVAPAPGTITCQMYCGKRRIWDLNNKKCHQITISTACSCPGFDDEKECNQECN